MSLPDLSNVVWYSTPAQIEAFCLAEWDRRQWLHGYADEQHIPEPLDGDPTRPLPRLTDEQKAASK